MMKLLIAATMLVAAQAACPNSCSGHGTCGDNEVCSCHDNFGMGGLAGGDCSDRMCPYELAWVDSPMKDGSTHNYAECAAKGICDRSTGACECFAGYDGKACGRQVCQDDCSGHGTCEFMNELTFGTVYNDFFDGTPKAWAASGDDTTPGAATYVPGGGSAILFSDYYGTGVGAIRPATDMSWDASRARACVCDAGYTGLSCTSRMCPVGNDILDTRANTGIDPVDQVQLVVLYSGGVDGAQNYTATTNAVGVTANDIGPDYDGTGANRAWSMATAADFVSKTFALQFTSKLNETFITAPIQLTHATTGWTQLNADVKAALEALPNKVINGVTVTSTDNAGEFTYGRGIVMQITFTGSSVEGNQNLLEVVTNPCGAGCTPRLTGLTKLASVATANVTMSYIKQHVSADFNSFECGRRGKCDLETGICACFEGYTSEACTTMSSLV